ncbi:hypothetical protein MHYP_G00349370 [Metynnis hypsauchen]
MSLGGIDTIAQTNGLEVSAALYCATGGPLLWGPYYSLIKGGGASGFPSMWSRKAGQLHLSCTRAVLSLLPKKDNLGLLKNWRPVALH